MNVDEWAFVKKCRIHDPTVGQVIDDHIHEFDLVGSQRLVGEEIGEGLLG